MAFELKDIAKGVREALYGREVREWIAQMGEWTYTWMSEQVKKVEGLLEETKKSESAAASSAAAAAGSAAEAGKSATAAAGSAASAGQSASAAAGSAEKADASAKAAAKSQTEAAKNQEQAAAAAALAGTRAGTDKTLTIEDAPADAKAVGDRLANIKTTVDATLTLEGEAADAKAVGDALAGKLGLHDTAEDSTKWAGLTLRQAHNTSDTWIPVFCEGFVDYVLKSEIVPAKLGQSGNPDIPMQFNWSGQNGQPTWLWGGNDGQNMYVWNPSNFNVNAVQGFYLGAQSWDPGAGSSLGTNRVLLVYK